MQGHVRLVGIAEAPKEQADNQDEEGGDEETDFAKKDVGRPGRMRVVLLRRRADKHS